MIQTYNYFNQQELPSLLLCNPNKAQRFSLGHAYNIKNTLKYNALSELQFDYPMVTGSETIYDEIQGRMLVLVEGVGYYIIQSAPENLTGSAPIKNVSCLSLEAEMLSRRLTGFTGTYAFQHLLEHVLALIPTWTIGTIETSLLLLYRTFSSNNSTVYNFLVTEMEKAYGCVFEFDTFNKTVSAVSNTVPAANTNIILSFDNLVSSIEFKEITEELCTALYCYGGESLDIHYVNPLGTNAIYNFDYFKYAKWMSQGLITALNAWEVLVDAQQPIYAAKLAELAIYNEEMLVLAADLTELISSYNSALNVKEVRLQQLLDITQITADIAALLIEITSKGIDIASLQQTINFLQEDLRKIVHLLYFSSEISFTAFETDVTTMGTDLGTIRSTWTDYYNAESNSPGFNVTYFNSQIATINSLLVSVQDKNTVLLDYLAALTSYPPVAGILTTINGYITSEITDINSLYSLLQSIIPNTSITITLDEMRTTLDAYLDIIYYPGNMTSAQYLELSSYIYENTYTNSNIILTSLAERQVQSQQLYDQAEGVLLKAAYPRYEFTGSFSNFIALKGFSNFTTELELGKVINVVKNDSTIIQSVLLEVAVSYDNPTDFGLTFGNSFRLNNPMFIYGDLLGAAAQMGSNLPSTSALTGTGTATNIAGSTGGISLESTEHGLTLVGQVLDFPLFSTKSPAGSIGENIWLGGGGESVSFTSGNDGGHNTSFGIIALFNNTTGNANSSFGWGSMECNTTGEGNTAIGRSSLNGNLIGSSNVAMGEESLFWSIGNNNSGIGYQALHSLTSGANNTALGYAAGDGITTGGNNTIIGANITSLASDTSDTVIIGTGGGVHVFSTFKGANASGYNIWIGGGGKSSLGDIADTTKGSRNTSLGSDALLSITTGQQNNAFGRVSLWHNTTGNYNVAIGNTSLHNNSDGDGNVAVGYNSLATNTTADFNTGVGHEALAINSTGTKNAGVGKDAIRNNTTGSNNTGVGVSVLTDLNITANDGSGNNTAVGYGTGLGITTGINNTIIGANVTGLSNTLSDTVVLADGAGVIRFYSDATYKGQLQTAITSSKVLTLTSAETYTLTIPATGVAALLGTANVFTAAQTINLGLIVNEDGDATGDFRVESDTYDALFVDASNDSVMLMGNTAGKVGFYGITAVVQQILDTGGGHTADDIITFLQTVGLCKQA
jgi:hypothetical protein